MQKIQILFPEPQLRRLRRIAKSRDVPISEIVRRATEAWLERTPEELEHTELPQVPVFAGGKLSVPPQELRELSYSDRQHSQ